MDGKGQSETGSAPGAKEVNTGGASGGANTNSNSGTSKGTGTGTGSGASKEVKTPAVDGIPVNIPVINIPVQAAAPAAKKKASGSSAAKEKDLDKTLESNVRTLIGAGFGFAAKITNNEIWTVSDEEAQSISTPTTKILQRLGLNESMNKYADYIALMTALSVVIVPRVMIQLAQKGEKHDARKETTAAAPNKPAGGSAAPSPGEMDSGIKAVLDCGA